MLREAYVTGEDDRWSAIRLLGGLELFLVISKRSSPSENMGTTAT